MPTIDFNAASELDVIAKGDYPAVFDSYEMAEGEKGPYAACVFRISDADEEYAGRKLYRNMSFSAQSLWNAKKTIRNMGYSGNLDGVVEIEDVLNECLGQDCRIRVGVKKYEGQDRNEVKAVLEPDYAALAR